MKNQVLIIKLHIIQELVGNILGALDGHDSGRIVRSRIETHDFSIRIATLNILSSILVYLVSE